MNLRNEETNYSVNYAEILIDLMNVLPSVDVTDRFYTFSPPLKKYSGNTYAKDNFNPRFDLTQLFQLNQHLINLGIIDVISFSYANTDTFSRPFCLQFSVNIKPNEEKYKRIYEITNDSFIDIWYIVYVYIIRSFKNDSISVNNVI